MPTASEFCDALLASGLDFFAGVPCSLLATLLAELQKRPGVPYVPAVKEDAAMGVAAGAYLAGRRPAVLMQNSGLGHAINPITSLHLVYRIPCVLLVSWRGCPEDGRDAPEHDVMGRITPDLLRTIGVEHQVVERESYAEQVRWAVSRSEELAAPVALVLRKGVVR
jgi:sulfopyruvate decarboxylase alpha subunit